MRWTTVVAFAGLLSYGTCLGAGKAERFPTFEGSIIPIQKPFRAEYHSFESIETTTMSISVKESNKLGENGNVTMTSERIMTRSGNRITHKTHMTELNSSMAGTDQPGLDDLRAMMAIWVIGVGDIRGNIKEVNVEGYESVFKTTGEPVPVRGTPEYNEIVATLRGAVEIIAPFSNAPITTGSVLNTTSLSRFAGPDADDEFLKMLGNPVLENKVRGWGYYDGRKVLVTNMNVEIPLNIPREEGNGSMHIIGYSLFDAITMAAVKNQAAMMFVGWSATGDENFTYRMDFDMEAKITYRPDGPTNTAVRTIAIPKLTRLLIDSKDDGTGGKKAYAFFDLEWTVTPPSDKAVSGKLVLIDKSGKERVAMPWTISAENASQGSFRESQTGFELASFGAAEQWLRLSDVADLRVRFDSDP